MKILARDIKKFILVGWLLFQDLLLLTGALWCAFWLRFSTNFIWSRQVAMPDLASYELALVITLYLVIAQLAASGLYSLDQLRTWREDLSGIARSVGVAALLLLSLSFFYRKINYSRQVVLMAWPMAILSLQLGRAFFQGAIIWGRNRGLFYRRALILGQGSMASILIEKITSRQSLGFRIAGRVDNNAGSGDISNIPYLGPKKNLDEILKRENIQVVFFVEDKQDEEELLEYIEICEANSTELLLIPQVYDLLIDFSGLKEAAGLPMVELREEPIRWGNLLVKRVLDFVLAGALLILTLPLQIFIAMAIRLDSPGPALFSQVRVGYRGRKFRMLKFRSMDVDAEKKLANIIDLEKIQEPVFKIKDDPRVTRLGKWLRQTSLDELPQLYNVVVGEMSLVGPRPEEEEMVKRYNVWQRRRLKVKPGLTGLQQIKCRGSASLSERLKYDIYYIRKLGVLLDLEILVRTIWVVLSQEGAH